MCDRPPRVTVDWTNVICLALIIFAIMASVHMHEEIAAFLGAMGQIGPGYSPEEQSMGLIAFGLVAVTIVALAKILVERK